MSSVSINEMVNRLMFILLSDSISIFCIVFFITWKVSGSTGSSKINAVGVKKVQMMVLVLEVNISL